MTVYASEWWASSSTNVQVATARAAAAHRPEHELGAAELTVPAVTVPGLLHTLGWDRVDVVKMDIEGAEEDVLLHGDASWLGQVGILVLDIHSKYVSRDRIVECLGAHGFQPAADDGQHAAVFLSAARDGRG